MAKAKFAYTGIGVRDLDRSTEFYTEKLGMKVLGRYKIKETNGEIVELMNSDDGPMLELNWYADRKEYKNGDEVDHLAFEVEDVDEVLEELRSQGIEVALEPFDEGDSRLAFVKDPDGIWIELQGQKKK